MDTNGAMLSSAQAAREFALAGDARLTLVSRRTGQRFTYRVRATDGTGPATHFVGVLSGPDNVADYSYLGFMRRGWEREPTSWEHGRHKSRIDSQAPSARAFAWFAQRVLLRSGDDMPEGLEVWHEGRCGRCGRALTVPESIARGVGPECAGVMGLT